MFIKITTDSNVNENDLNKQTYFRLKLNGLEREILHLNLSQWNNLNWKCKVILTARHFQKPDLMVQVNIFLYFVIVCNRSEFNFF